MKKLLTLSLTLVILADFTGLGAAQQKAEEKSRPTGVEMKQPAPGEKKAPGKAKICVLKFNDLNGNGVQDRGDLGLLGWTIEIKDAGGNVVATVTTGPAGSFCVGVPAPATYTVSEVLQAGWTQTFPAPPGTHTLTVSPGQLVNLNFGNKKGDKKKCDLVIGKSPSKGSIPLVSGQQATFEIVVTNQGTGPCDPPIQVTDALPSGLTFVAGGPPPWICSGPSCIYNQVLAPGQSVLLLITVNVTTPPGTSIRNCAGVKNPNDTNLANNEVCITLPVVPGKSCDLEIKKSISPNPLVSGQPATVTITVTNVGAPCPPGSYPWTYVQDPEPAGLNFTAVIANPPGWSCAIGFGLPDEAHCRNNSTLPTAYTVSIFFHGTVHAPPGSTITNCATVSNQNDTNPANNKSCVIVPVKP